MNADEPGVAMTYVLIPGAGGSADYWHLLVDELARRGREAVAVRLLVLVNPMIPAPGETPGDWWAATGHAQARAAYAAAHGRDPDAGVDLAVDFFHDVPAEVSVQLLAAGGPQESAAVFSRPNPLRRWPDVPTRVVTGRDDRFFPAGFQRRLARERLGVEPDELPGGHLLALSQPGPLADRLEAYRRAR